MKNAVNEYMKEHRLQTLFEVRPGHLGINLSLVLTRMRSAGHDRSAVVAQASGAL